MLDLHPAAREISRVLDGVTDKHLDGPTPCPGSASVKRGCGRPGTAPRAAPRTCAQPGGAGPGSP